MAESAIPPHLQRARTRLAGTPDGYQPPVPAWVSRFDERIGEVVMAYFGIQSKTTLGPGGLVPITTRFASPKGPRHWDLASHVDNRGYHTVIAIAYWTSQADFDAWCANSGFDAWWQDRARESEPFGYFLEILMPAVDQFETLFSSPDRAEGVAHLQSAVSDQVLEHNYWGSARDRLPASQVDALEPGSAPGASVTTTTGTRVVVPGRDNLTLIRSGQDWSDTAGKERELYLKDIRPTLAAGMNYLRDEGAAIGCLSCRLMTLLDERGNEIDKTFGLAHFDSLANLEQWAKSHPTHLAIFQGFMKYVQELNFQIALRLYHEVAVVPADRQYFEYVNCHSGTGLLPSVTTAQAA